MTDTVLADDILYGVDDISKWIKRSPRQTYYMLAHGQIPGFKLGKTWAARKSTLVRDIEAKEAAGAKDLVA